MEITVPILFGESTVNTLPKEKKLTYGREGGMKTRKDEIHSKSIIIKAYAERSREKDVMIMRLNVGQKRRSKLFAV